MSALLNAVDAFIEDIWSDKAWVEELNEHSRTVAKHFNAASLEEINAALHKFAALFPEIPLVAVGMVAITCGSLVERGGDPDIVGPGLLEKLPRVNETATGFCNRCRALALADTELINELRGADDEELPDPVDIIDRHVANDGWQALIKKFGPVIFKDHPYDVLGKMADEFFRLGLIAHLSRSKPLRAISRAQPELLIGTQKSDRASGWHRSFLANMLQVLDNESLLVLHVEQKKGFDVRISGVAGNFQLNTLLAGAIIGAPEQGWIAGEAPSPRAIAECRDAQFGPQGGEHVIGAFNLCNWTALKPDGSLRDGQGKEAIADWIWGEGCPCDIVPFDGRRIVLVGRPPYQRGWTAGRQFHGMTGELVVERKFDTAAVNDWLHRLSLAAQK